MIVLRLWGKWPFVECSLWIRYFANQLANQLIYFPCKPIIWVLFFLSDKEWRSFCRYKNWRSGKSYQKIIQAITGKPGNWGLLTTKFEFVLFPSGCLLTLFVYISHLKSDLLATELNVMLLLLLMHYYCGGYLLNCGSNLCFIRCSVWFLQAMSFYQRLLRRWESSDDAKSLCLVSLCPLHRQYLLSGEKQKEEWQGRCVTGEGMNLLPGGSSYSHTNNISLNFLQDFS